MTFAATLLAAACTVTGTVTFIDHVLVHSGVVESEPDGVPLWMAGEINGASVSSILGADRLAVGDRVIVRGERSELGFAPGLAAREIEFVSHGTLADAPEVRLADLNWGVRDNERVSIRGVLTEVRDIKHGFVRLSLSSDDGVFAAEAPIDAYPWQDLVDAELRLTGTAMSFFNVRGEFVGVLMQVVQGSDVKVLEMSADPFSKPLTPLHRVLPYSPEGVDLHRHHVKGVVTYVKPGYFFWLQDGSSSLKVCASDVSVVSGDEIEAVGFVSRTESLARLVSATVRKLGHAGLPEPSPVGYGELASYPVDSLGQFICYDGRYAAVEGQLVSVAEEPGCAVLRLVLTGLVPGEHAYVTVRMENMDSPVSPDDVAWGPKLKVRGVMELEQETGMPSGYMPTLRGWTFRVISPDAVTVVHDASWTAHRTSLVWRWIRFSLIGAIVAALGFAVVLLVRLRGERRRLAILAAERKRMAADLHDTLEQHLAGTRMMLNTAVAFSPDVPETVKTAVAQANEILAHAKNEMRARIFDMRSDVLFTQGPARVFRSLASKLSSSGGVKVHTRLRGLPERLNESVFAELVFIVQEAVTNAIKHGHCRNIVIGSDPSPEGFTLRVANDGEPFDPSHALGPEAGHYGLSGMRERAKRAQIGLKFESSGRWMVLRLSVKV